MLYKFSPIDIFLYKNLMNGILWFSNPREFNDLYEFTIVSDKGMDDDKARAYYDLLNKLDNNRLMQDHSLEAFIQHSRNIPDKVIQLVVSAFEARINSFGVTCFSEDVFNDLMWGNYANKHSGLALGFEGEVLDESIIKRNDVMTVLSPVDYQDEDFDVSFTSDFKRNAELIYKVVSSKHSIWRNEKETRIISQKQGAHYFDKSSLKEVCFGVRTHDAEITDIINLITRFEYSSVEFFRLKPVSYNKYEKELIKSI